VFIRFLWNILIMTPFTIKLLLKCFLPVANGELSPIEGYRSCWNMIKKNKTIEAFGESNVALEFALWVKESTEEEVKIICKNLQKMA
jgi:hypothetical protein